jgi:hypothetical protein
MKALGWAAAAVMGALLLIAVDVFALGDRTVLVAPPEAVAEGFVRKIVTERYDVAMDQLSSGLRRKVKPEQLRAAWRRLKPGIGEVEDVSGEPGPVHGDEAEASAVLENQRRDKIPLRLHFKREHGAWAIDDLGELAPAD